MDSTINITNEENTPILNNENTNDINGSETNSETNSETSEIPEELLEEHIIGIDLGTTNTCVAIWRNQNVEIIPDKHGNRTIPSFVAYTNYQRYIGQDAKNMKDLNPSNVFYEVKRLIGRKMDDPLVINEREYFSYNIEAGEHNNIMLCPELSNNKLFTPEEISAAILTEAKHMATAYLKEKITKCIITVPAYFNDGQRQATKDAAEIAGMECIRIINEPISAALAYGLFQRSQYEHQKQIVEARKRKLKEEKDLLKKSKIEEVTNETSDEIETVKMPDKNINDDNKSDDNKSNDNKSDQEESEYETDEDDEQIEYYEDTSKLIIVYDFGGGTLDVSILKIENGIFEVLAYGGNSRMGGSDFDNRLMSVCINIFKKQNKITEITKLPSLSLQKLRLACEQAKKILSTVMKTRIIVRDFYDGKDFNWTFTRKDFEEMCEDLFFICLRPVDDVLKKIDMDPSDVDEIIMVGGMTRMPLIRQLIKQKFAKEPNCTINPEEAVAAGAAIQGYLLSHKDDPFSESVTLLDATALSLGVDSDGGVMSTIIERGETFPVSKSKDYSTDSDNVSSVMIKVYEGERTLVEENFFVGEFELIGIDPAPRGIPEIEVTFSIDANGLIIVSAQNKKTYETSSLTVTSNKSRLTRDQIEALVEEAKELEIRDELEKRKKLMHYEIHDFCNNILKNIEIKEIKLTEISKNAVIKDVEETLQWLKEKTSEQRDDEEYEKVIKNLKDQYGTLILHGYIGNKDLKDCEENGNKNGVTVYGNDADDDEQDINKIYDKLEDEQKGYKGLSDPEKAEFKELRQAVTDLCYSIFDIVASGDLKISSEHLIELKDYIDDSLIWLHVHEKPSKAEYKIKIDEINNTCDKLFSHYESANKEFFKHNEMIESIKNKRDELENLCIVIKLMLDDDAFPLNNEILKPFSLLICNTLEWIYKNDIDVKNPSIDKDNSIAVNNYHGECADKLNEINEQCDIMHQKMQGINVNEFKSTVGREKIILTGYVESESRNNEECETGGTSIVDLLRRRQQDILAEKINASAYAEEDNCGSDSDVEDIGVVN